MPAGVVALPCSKQTCRMVRQTRIYPATTNKLTIGPLSALKYKGRKYVGVHQMPIYEYKAKSVDMSSRIQSSRISLWPSAPSARPVESSYPSRLTSRNRRVRDRLRLSDKKESKRHPASQVARPVRPVKPLQRINPPARADRAVLPLIFNRLSAIMHNAQAEAIETHTLHEPSDGFMSCYASLEALPLKSPMTHRTSGYTRWI